MFYYTNGKLKVFAHSRCGNTNMHHYFGVDPNRSKTFPAAFSNNLVVVLRNPLDRVMSAINAFPNPLSIFHLVNPLTTVTGKEFTDKFVEEYVVFYLHCNPFLYKIENNPFRIIDFNKLSDYIPRRTDLMQSPVTNTRGYTDPKSVYVENSYFTLEDLEREYEVYCRLLNSREQISVIEWKEKTT